jgi:hypothetical protein
MEILNNPWVIGIVGGIISGLLVYLFTYYLLSRKQNKEYSQRVSTANKALLHTIRPLIVQKKIPSKTITESIIESIAREHKVNTRDILSVQLLVDDLIKEVMENAFLDSIQKLSVSNKILKINSDKSKSIRSLKKVIFQKDIMSSRYMSLILSITVSTIIFVILLFESLNNPKLVELRESGKFPEMSTLSIVGIMLGLVLIILFVLSQKLEHKKQNKKTEEQDLLRKET